MSDDYTTISCACGAALAIVPKSITFTRFRCWQCPKDDTPPKGTTLTLIKGGKSV